MRGVGRRSALRASAVAQRKTKTKDNATHCILGGLATYSGKNTASQIAMKCDFRDLPRIMFQAVAKTMFAYFD